MDSHREQVMRAREAAGQGTRTYFAYSTILDREAFETWRGQHGYDFFQLPEGTLAEALDVDLVFDFPSRWWGGRVAGLRDAPGQSVWGRLFTVSEKDWPIVQHKEGAITGMSVERELRVRTGDREIPATAFVTSPKRASMDGPVSERFLEALIRGAIGAGLPADYLARLRGAVQGG